jgi:hypothetical protein
VFYTTFIGNDGENILDVNLSRLYPSYISEVHRFIDIAMKHAWRTKTNHIYCPRLNCKNVVVFDDTNQIISHLVCRGFVKDYIVSTKHGEGSSSPYTTGNLRTTYFSSFMGHTNLFHRANM